MNNQIYLIGSLRNPRIPQVGNWLRDKGYNIFDDWHAAGPEADDCWQAYEKARGRSFPQALTGAAAQNVYHFDKRNLDASDAAVLIMPAGKSGHLELGYMAGKGKTTFILMEGEPERYDVMYNFADGVFFYKEDLEDALFKLFKWKKKREVAPIPGDVIWVERA